MPRYADNIEQRQEKISAALRAAAQVLGDLPPSLRYLRLLVPAGFVPKVSLRHPVTGNETRQIRQNAAPDSWDPGRDIIQISYEAVDEPESTDDCDIPLHNAGTPRDASPQSQFTPGEQLPMSDYGASNPSTRRQLGDIIRALDVAERDAALRHRDFVGLKLFSNTILPRTSGVWALNKTFVFEAVNRAIEMGCITKGEERNPGNPVHPTTSIKLNRSHPLVLEFLGESLPQMGDFSPIAIRGEPLSRTILRERR